MHFQMGYGTYEKRGEVQDWINAHIRADGFSTYRRGGTPIGGTTPAQPAQDVAVAALYDAVPVIDMDRAAQLVDAVTAGPVTLADVPQDEWDQLVADVKEIRAQLNGDGTFDTGSSPDAVKRVEDAHASGKPMSLLDIATWLKNHVSTHKAPTP
jgi:hypothetical protein